MTDDVATVLALDELCVDYLSPSGPVRAVDRVSLTVRSGEVLGLVGESGSGKSTIAGAVLRTLQAPAAITGGSVSFKNRDVLRMSEEELRAFRWDAVSLVFQSAMSALNPVLRVGEQISDVMRAHRAQSPVAARERAHELLRLVGLKPEHYERYPHQLSGGMRQRVVIAIALALQPSLVIMDEPTTALDVVVQHELLQEILELKRELGFSILFISHDLSLMLQLCDRIAVMYAAKLVEVAPAADLATSPKHPYTQALLHSYPGLAGPRRQLTGIPGVPPDLRRPPAGCRFNPRCSAAFEPCAQRSPELLQLTGTDRRVACHAVSHD